MVQLADRENNAAGELTADGSVPQLNTLTKNSAAAPQPCLSPKPDGVRSKLSRRFVSVPADV